MGVNSLPKSVIQQRCDCDLNPRPFCAWVQHANHSTTEPPPERATVTPCLFEKCNDLAHRIINTRNIVLQPVTYWNAHRPWAVCHQQKSVSTRISAVADKSRRNRERKCADTIGTVPVPSAGHFQCRNINIFFSTKYTEAILSNSTRKLLWFEITKMLIAV